MAIASGELPYYLNDFVRLRSMWKFTAIISSDIGNKLLKSSSPYDVATFVAKLGADHYTRFANTMRKIFGPSVKVGVKSNVLRIAQKIEDIMEERNLPANQAWYYLTDILRGSIYCESPEEII